MSQSTSLYLDLMKACLTNTIYGDENILGGGRKPFDAGIRAESRGWRVGGHTMVARKLLEYAQSCGEDVLARGVPGGLMETGVSRGGVVILIRAVQNGHGVTDRRVWAADSVEG